ncbi:hypothetical protein D3C72_1977740 [compost metagenome]
MSGFSCAGAIGIARAWRKNHDSSGTLKMLWSIRKRTGRGLQAISTTASAKLTWLQTSTAGPSAGMRSALTRRSR